MELAVLLLILVLIVGIPLLVGYWVSQDAKKRGSDHGLAWGVMTFLSGLAYLFPLVIFVAFYFVVRDDFGAASAA